MIEELFKTRLLSFFRFVFVVFTIDILCIKISHNYSKIGPIFHSMSLTDEGKIINPEFQIPFVGLSELLSSIVVNL